MIKRGEKIFVCIEAAFYAAFTALDISEAGSTTALKFSAMAVCLAFSGYFSLHGGEKIVTAALALSVSADVLLLILDKHYIVGVLLFFAVQILYFMRIMRSNGRHGAWPVRVCAAAAAVLLVWALDMLTPLNAVASVYFSFFVCNAVQARRQDNRLFFAGLCLFLCCDVCVGLHNIQNLLPDSIADAAAVGMWTFYLPSQVLIALSGRKQYDE